ncbi:hypothetical protein OO002_33070, partial [Pseudomonas aeruginosa]|uniref:hypothetical protein n=1 Tax=Pseudomonas aeruginosa TaxID=287 RepID=UPI0022436FC1
QADLDRDALCGAEFVIGHGATPYRNGRVLHSVFAAARLNVISCGGSNWLVQFSFLIFEAWVWGGSGSPSGAQRTGFWCFGTLLFFGVIASLKLIFLQSVFVREFVLCFMS